MRFAKSYTPNCVIPRNLPIKILSITFKDKMIVLANESVIPECNIFLRYRIEKQNTGFHRIVKYHIIVVIILAIIEP
jgi:primosomal replication protein N